MVPANSFVDFFQDVLGFLFVDTLQGMEKPFLYRVSFRIENLVAFFLTFLASSKS